MENIEQNKCVKGALILLLGGTVCKFIGAFYRIPLSNILGAEGIGVYQLIFPIFSLFLIIASGGIPVALSKIVAECRARKEHRRAKRFLLQGIIYLLIISSIFSLIFIIFSNKIASFQGNALAGLGYLAVGIAIFFASILTAFRGYFQGYQNMVPTAISQIIEQIFKLVLGLLFSYLLIKDGIAFGVFGALLGIAVGEIISFIYLIITFTSYRRKVKNDLLEAKEIKIKEKFREDFRFLIKKTLPLTLNIIILPLILAVDSILIVNLLVRAGMTNSFSTQIFGVYSGMVNSFINFPTIVALSLAISIVPAISYRKEKGEDISNLIVVSFKILLFVSIPCILIFIFFPNQIMLILYPSATSFGLLNLGTNLLRISAINILYISLLAITTAILQASNKSLISLINLFFAGILKIVLTIFFVLSPLNIYGAAISSILCFAFASGLNIIALKNKFNFRLDIKRIGYIFLSSSIMLGGILGLNYLFNLILSSIISLVLSILSGGIIYLFFILYFPIFEEKEIDKIPFGNRINFIRNKIRIKEKTKN